MKKQIDRIDGLNKKAIVRKWLFRTTITCLAIAFSIASYYGYHFYKSISAGYDKQMDYKSKLRSKEVEISKTPFTILFSGTDQRKANSSDWRPDVLMLVTVNPKSKSVKVASIPRDSYVTISNTGGYKTKINAAAAYGRIHGIDPDHNIRETVEDLLQIPIDYYARVNFQGFTDIVDSLGGVDVNVKYHFTQTAIGGKVVDYTPGNMHLNGAETLAYVRQRKQNIAGDKDRNTRQQEVVAQLFDKLTSIYGVTKLSELAKTLGANIKYSFELNEIPALTNIYKETRKNIEIITVHTEGIRKDGHGWIEILSEEERLRISNLLQEHIEYNLKLGLKRLHYKN